MLSKPIIIFVFLLAVICLSVSADLAETHTTSLKTHQTIANSKLSDTSPFQWSYVRLDYARREKVQQLSEFCQRMQQLATSAANDKLVKSCFEINLKYASANKHSDCPDQLHANVAQLRQGFEHYYVQEYFSFYDMLFIDNDGNIFYSVRKESDIATNLLEDPADKRPLAACLRQKPKKMTFVDFHRYGPSDEAAAFFVEPIVINSKPAGYLVLQCAANKLDSIFAWTEDLGATGETFLVNQNGYMLSESNFDGDSTILRQKLDDRNIRAKFREGTGHRVVMDYRGCRAISSFEVVEFLDTHWLVVAKLDIDEVITRHFTEHRKYYQDMLLSSLRHKPVAPLNSVDVSFDPLAIRTDMDEFMKSDNGRHLETFGVSTCTAVIVSYPGKFAYLAHISPRDRIYGSGDTNLLAQMLKKVSAFDIYPSEKRKLQFIVVANHLNTAPAIINQLLQDGFLLSQIHIAYRPSATAATLDYDYCQDKLRILWKNSDGHHVGGVRLRTELNNIGHIIEQTILQTDTHQPLSIQRQRNQGGQINVSTY